MNVNIKFDEPNFDNAVNYARESAGDDFNDEIGIVLKVALSDFRNLPRLGFDESQPILFKSYVGKWVQAYLSGYKKRPSIRTGKKSGTHSDPLIRLILEARIPSTEGELANQIESGHSLMMTMENLAGDLLEEYLADKLHSNGWFCCWGSCIDAVDFCKEDGSLLQVKNSDNSENSSSSRVRNGTEIKKWARRKSSKSETFFWNELNTMMGSTDFSEDDFRAFVKATVKSNPACIYLEDDNPLNKI